MATATNESDVCELLSINHEMKQHQLQLEPMQIPTKYIHVSNYFELALEPGSCVHKHNVQFDPPIETRRARKNLVRRLAELTDKPYIYDGIALYLRGPLQLETILSSKVSKDVDSVNGDSVKITIQFAGQLNDADYMQWKFFDIMVRKCLKELALTNLNNAYYNPLGKCTFREEGSRVDMWPGYILSVKQCQDEHILLGVKNTQIFVRHQTVWDFMLKQFANEDLRPTNACGRKGSLRPIIRLAMIGQVVVTTYNNRIYRIDDVNWNLSPDSKFYVHGVNRISYREYYSSRYGAQPTAEKQPLLVVVSSKKNKNGDRVAVNIHLVPELCYMAGLPKDMKEDEVFTDYFARNVHLDPYSSFASVEEFMVALKSTLQYKKEKRDWGLWFSSLLTNCPGSTLLIQAVILGGNRPYLPLEYTWAEAFKSRQMLSSVPLQNWSVVVPESNYYQFSEFLKTMRMVANVMGLDTSSSPRIITVDNLSTLTAAISKNGYIAAVNDSVSSQTQIVLVILKSSQFEVYQAVKKRLTNIYKVPSQCLLAKNLRNPAWYEKIATNLLIQMNAKMGGQPWGIQLPSEGIMIIGCCTNWNARAAKQGLQAGAVATVATFNDNIAQYFNTVSQYAGNCDLRKILGLDVKKSLDHYRSQNNGSLPTKLIFYRLGRAEKLFLRHYEEEADCIYTALEEYYKGNATINDAAAPKFVFIAVTRKTITKFVKKKIQNPNPGTVLHETIIAPGRFEFYMISSAVKYGTANPCLYAVIRDYSGWSRHQLQQFTFKMCHLYYNHTGPISLPAPCLYARKLLSNAVMVVETHKMEDELKSKMYYI